MSFELHEMGLDPWGPIVEDGSWLHCERVAEIIARRRQLPLAEVADALIEGELRHRYLVLAKIADGRRSVMLEAVDLLLAREVAIKVHRADTEGAMNRALAEARVMSRVEHPNIVPALDVGRTSGRPYIVMELCDTDLAAWSADGPWTELLDRILKAGAGLEALHDAGLIHADVKPANILLRHGVAKLGDFELAGPPGHTFRISGTAGFIAPEAADGLRTRSADVFGLACTAWECLFGTSPFGAEMTRDTSTAALTLLARARAEDVQLPARLPHGLPRRLVEVLMSGLVADPRRRAPLQRWLSNLRATRASSTCARS